MNKKELFVLGVIESLAVWPPPPMTEDQARKELEEIKKGPWDIPKGLGPKTFARIWEELRTNEKSGFFGEEG